MFTISPTIVIRLGASQRGVRLTSQFHQGCKNGSETKGNTVVEKRINKIRSEKFRRHRFSFKIEARGKLAKIDAIAGSTSSAHPLHTNFTLFLVRIFKVWQCFGCSGQAAAAGSDDERKKRQTTTRWQQRKILHNDSTFFDSPKIEMLWQLYLCCSKRRSWDDCSSFCL